MISTAKTRRGAQLLLGCGLSLMIAACAHRGGVSAENAEISMGGSEQAISENWAAEAGQSTEMKAMPDAQMQTEVLMEADAAGFGIEHITGDNYESIILKSAHVKPEFELTELENPSRLVIDISNLNTRLNRVFDLAGAEVSDGMVSRVRVGAHPDKSRVVLDLTGGQGARHSVDTIGNDVVVTLVNSEHTSVARLEPKLFTEDLEGTESEVTNNVAAESLTAESLTVAAAETSEMGVPFESSAAEPAPEMLASSEHGDDHDEHGDEGHEGADHEHLQDTTVAKPVQVAESRPIVKGYSIEASEAGANRIVADVTEAGFYELQRTAQSEYVLRIENATIGDEAIRPILASPLSKDIKSVRASREGDDVLLRIFTAPDTVLRASAKSGKIQIAAVDTSDMRAQPESEIIADAGDASAAGAVNSEVENLLADRPKYTGRLISLDLQDTDIDNALRIIAEVSNLNIIASDDVTGKVTLRLIDVPWDQALDVILKTNGLDRVQEGNVIRVAPVEKLRQEREALKLAQQAEEDLEPLEVRYIRVNYAKAADLKPLVETILTERGAVEYDERSNQLIIKDINKGIKHVAELVARLDQRTPQVLLETQIVEANRNLLRDLGMELGFSYEMSPSIGNATGYNFPNAINVGGSVTPGSAVGSSFPAAISQAAGSAVTAIFDSADGSSALEARISSLESEGRVRIVSRPSVATINNKQAMIKSVEKIRVRTPDSGLSVATGQGASASSAGNTATEVIEVGIILEVTPQASPDYYVLLDINAKSSTLGSTVVDSIPSEIERAATSTVLVSSGQTFALGGIYKITDRDAVSGVPFLKDVPFLGHLFRNLNTNNSDEELIFFITPRIVEGSFEDAETAAS